MQSYLKKKPSCHTDSDRLNVKPAFLQQSKNAIMDHLKNIKDGHSFKEAVFQQCTKSEMVSHFQCYLLRGYTFKLGNVVPPNDFKIVLYVAM